HRMDGHRRTPEPTGSCATDPGGSRRRKMTPDGTHISGTSLSRFPRSSSHPPGRSAFQSSPCRRNAHRRTRCSR
ncbi:MAG: hypothetical protein ACK55I_24530, partial [bacterium]